MIPVIRFGDMADIAEIMIVMRHGFRADKAGEEWSESVTRPWDSPLSSSGWKEALQSGGEVLKLLKKKPDVIFSSPYTRCLQTASTIVKACGMSFKDMIIDKGLSESYDYIHTVRSVSSDDMIIRGRYANMKAWFLSKRWHDPTHSSWFGPVWRLKSDLTLRQRVNRFVFDAWKEPTRARVDLRERGRYPDYEMFVNLFFNRENQNERYVQAFQRCLRILEDVQTKKPRTGVIVTHGAGVRSLYERLLQASPGKIDTGGYFVVCRERHGAFELLADRLTFQ